MFIMLLWKVKCSSINKSSFIYKILQNWNVNEVVWGEAFSNEGVKPVFITRHVLFFQSFAPVFK